MIIGTKAQISLLMGTLVIAVTIVSLQFDLASALPDQSTLHDYSLNLTIADYSPNATSTFNLRILTNADTFNPATNVPDEKKLHFDVEGPARSPEDNNSLNGYFEITIPHALLGGEYTVLVNNATFTNYNMTYNPSSTGDQNGDSTTIAFNYDGTTVKSIVIYGTTAIPEFGSSIAIVAGACSIAVLRLSCLYHLPPKK